jgi:hypothetical protein
MERKILLFVMIIFSVLFIYAQNDEKFYASEIDGFVKLSKGNIKLSILDYEYNGEYSFEVEAKNGIRFIKYFDVINILCLSSKLLFLLDPKKCFYEGVGYGNGRSGRHENFIGPAVKYTSSSFLTEGRKKYEAGNLSFLKLDMPWAEGVDGDGIGEYIDMEWDYEIGGLIIINGFISFQRPELYMSNNRVKKMQVFVNGEQDGFIYNLKDNSDPQIIQLNRQGKRVRIKILDVYNGSRWNDTCLSMINGINIDAGDIFYDDE